MLKIAGYIVLGGAVLSALGYLWKKLVKPMAKFITEADQMIPLLSALNETFKHNPTAFAVLDDIAAQFRTDSGSSLRDAVDGLVKSAAENKLAAIENKAAAEALKNWR
jgi:type II secretory pathway component PulM